MAIEAAAARVAERPLTEHGAEDAASRAADAASSSDVTLTACVRSRAMSRSVQTHLFWQPEEDAENMCSRCFELVTMTDLRGDRGASAGALQNIGDG